MLLRFGTHALLDDDALTEARARARRINTFAMQEVQAACRTLYEYANAMGAAFAPYVGDVADATLPLIVFKWSNDVRSVAGLLFPKLLNSLLEATRGAGSTDAEPILALLVAGGARLMHAIAEEHDAETRTSLAESISEVMQLCYYSLSSALRWSARARARQRRVTRRRRAQRPARAWCCRWKCARAS